MKEVRVLLPDKFFEMFSGFSPQVIKEIICVAVCSHFGLKPEPQRKKNLQKRSALRGESGKFASCRGETKNGDGRIASVIGKTPSSRAGTYAVKTFPNEKVIAEDLMESSSVITDVISEANATSMKQTKYLKKKAGKPALHDAYSAGL